MLGAFLTNLLHGLVIVIAMAIFSTLYATGGDKQIATGSKIERKRHNEKVKLTANFLNSSAVVFVAAGIINPAFASPTPSYPALAPSLVAALFLLYAAREAIGMMVSEE